MESEFWSEAFNQYKEFATLNLQDPLTMLSSVFEGQAENTASHHVTRSRTKSPTKSAAKRKAATRRKAPRTAAKRRGAGNGRALYTFPEHVEGRSEVRGQVH